MYWEFWVGNPESHLEDTIRIPKKKCINSYKWMTFGNIELLGIMAEVKPTFTNSI